MTEPIELKFSLNTLPQPVTDWSRLGGTADSADFQGPIAIPVSDDFRFAIFSYKSPLNTMVAPSQQWQTTHDLLPIRPIFMIRSPDPFLMIFVIFSLKSPPNIHSGQGIHLMRFQRTRFYHFFSLFFFSTANVVLSHYG